MLIFWFSLISKSRNLVNKSGVHIKLRWTSVGVFLIVVTMLVSTLLGAAGLLLASSPSVTAGERCTNRLETGDIDDRLFCRGVQYFRWTWVPSVPQRRQGRETYQRQRNTSNCE